MSRNVISRVTNMALEIFGQGIRDMNFAQGDKRAAEGAALEVTSIIADTVGLKGASYRWSNPGLEALKHIYDAEYVDIHSLVERIWTKFFAFAEKGYINIENTNGAHDMAGHGVRAGDTLAYPECGVEGYTSMEVGLISRIQDNGVAVLSFDRGGNALGGSLSDGLLHRVSESILFRR